MQFLIFHAVLFPTVYSVLHLYHRTFQHSQNFILECFCASVAEIYRHRVKRVAKFFLEHWSFVLFSCANVRIAWYGLLDFII